MKTKLKLLLLQMHSLSETVLIEGVVTDSHEQVFAKRFEAVVEDETGSIQS